MSVCYQMTKALLLGLLRDRKALITLFLMPLVTTMILSFALGPEFRGKSIPVFSVAVYNADQGPMGKHLVHALQAMKPTFLVQSVAKESIAKRSLTNHTATVAVEIPASYSRTLIHGKSASVSVLAPLNVETQRTMVADIVNEFGRKAGEQQYVADAERSFHQTFQVPFVQFDMKSSGIHAMTAGSYYAVGMMVLFLLSTALSRAYMVLFERKSDMFKRLTASPVNKSVLTTGYVVSNFLTLLIQGVLNLLCDKVILGVYLGPWWQTVILLAAYAAALSGMTVALGSFIDNEGVMNGINSLGGNVASILGGSIYPVYAFPNVMQWIAKVLPNGQVMHGFLNIISGITIMGLGTSIMYLLAVCVVTAVLARIRQWRPIHS